MSIILGLIIYVIIVVRCAKRKRLGILFFLTGIVLFGYFHWAQTIFEEWNVGIYPYDSNGNYIGDIYKNMAGKIQKFKVFPIFLILLGIVLMIKKYLSRHKKEKTL